MPQIDAPPVDDAEKLKLNDARRIPCFRNSMMYGFGGAFFGAGVRLLLTKGRTSMFSLYNFTVAGFLVGAAVRWPMCRKQYNQARDKAKELMLELQTREIEQNIKLGQTPTPTPPKL